MVFPGYAFGSFATHHLHELPLAGKDEGVRWTGVHAGRNLQVLAAVALNCNSCFGLPTDHPIRANHSTHPAAYTAVPISVHDARERVLRHGSGAADSHARSILAVPADQGQFLAHGLLDIQSAHRHRFLRNGPIEALAIGVLYSTRHLT
jgi:hypothetical protein